MTAIKNLSYQIEAARMLVATYRDILEDDIDALHIAVDGETNLHAAIRAAVGRIAELKILRTGIAAHVKGLKARADRYEAQEHNLRAAILLAMEVAQERRLEAPLGTVTVQAVAPSVMVTNEADIPAQFWHRADPTLDRKALLRALHELSADEHIPGAELSNGGTTVNIKLT